MGLPRRLGVEEVVPRLLSIPLQERMKPREERNEEDRSKVDDLRGTPMSVGTLEEIIDENHAIVSSSVGPEYYVNVLSFVDKNQLEPGSSILMHNKVKLCAPSCEVALCVMKHLLKLVLCLSFIL